MRSPWDTSTRRRFVGACSALIVGGTAGCSGDGDSDDGGGGGTGGETVVDESITDENTWNVELESGQTMTVNIDTSEGLARLQAQRPEGSDGERELYDSTSRDSIEFTHTAETSGEFVVNVQPSGTIGVQISVA